MKLLIHLLIGATALADMDPLVKWKEMPSWISSITANSKEIFATNSLWQLYRCVRPCNGTDWEYMGWYAAYTAANKWEVWVISVDGYIYRSRLPTKFAYFLDWASYANYINQQNANRRRRRHKSIMAASEFPTWPQVNGVLSSVTLGTNMVAGVNKNSDAFITPWDFAGNTTTQATWTSLPEKWKEVSLSADNQLWGVRTDGKVYRFRKKYATWDEIPNPTNINFSRLSVGRLYVYAVAVDDRIYRCVRPCIFGGWQLADGQMVAVNTGNTGDDQVFGINRDGKGYEGTPMAIQ